jgi:hypothetical protein
VQNYIYEEGNDLVALSLFKCLNKYINIANKDQSFPTNFRDMNFYLNNTNFVNKKLKHKIKYYKHKEDHIVKEHTKS